MIIDLTIFFSHNPQPAVDPIWPTYEKVSQFEYN